MAAKISIFLARVNTARHAENKTEKPKTTPSRAVMDLTKYRTKIATVGSVAAIMVVRILPHLASLESSYFTYPASASAVVVFYVDSAIQDILGLGLISYFVAPTAMV